MFAFLFIRGLHLMPRAAPPPTIPTRDRPFFLSRFPGFWAQLVFVYLLIRYCTLSLLSVPPGWPWGTRRHTGPRGPKRRRACLTRSGRGLGQRRGRRERDRGVSGIWHGGRGALWWRWRGGSTRSHFGNEHSRLVTHPSLTVTSLSVWLADKSLVTINPLSD